ncbi:hydroxyacid dehydrogenase [Candidatus Bipolaricaulota bacterium]|nr:hydroxyacid dehydrogenase [Candidatus Bipolaricaulota bacterium]MBS3814168.1 hydroxyacid dehydrogenase [Candidatus Bipolaricaulota bacterium]MBS3825313.1 hydroxyacid dehydrogenase [Candidatus Bipolaricaulota bacterium]
MTKILISDPIAEEGVEKLDRAGFELEHQYDLTAEELKREIGKFEGIVVRSATKLRAPILDEADNLELIVRAGVGLDNIDLDHADELGIEVRNTPEASSNSVAELALGHMLALARGIPRGTKSLKEQKWIKSELKGTELSGKTLGVIGIGRIGSLVAKKGMALGMKAVAFDKFIDQSPTEGVKMVEKDRLLSDSDYVTLHIPFVESEGATIGEAELKKMKESAFLINCARGGVVDEDALKRALDNEWIRGAGVDVFTEEPPQDAELLKFDNLSLTPHVGASTVEAQRRVGTQAADEFIDFFGKED